MISLPTARFSTPGLMAAWAVVVGGGILLVEGLSSREGASGAPPLLWPKESVIQPGAGRSTLLVFLHPRCPCSVATIEELSAILARGGQHVFVHAIMVAPKHLSEAWRDTDTSRAITALSAVALFLDSGGTEARRFRIETSGHVVVYNSRGHLTFSGGITSGPGRGGNDDARARLLARILGEKPDRSKFPVFGCPLFAPEPAVAEEPRR
jgi:hypothetical protein